jgi:hypothetical protein
MAARHQDPRSELHVMKLSFLECYLHHDFNLEFL